jgi:hypothetical protein
MKSRPSGGFLVIFGDVFKKSISKYQPEREKPSDEKHANDWTER